MHRFIPGFYERAYRRNSFIGHEDHIAGKGIKSLNHLQSGAQIHSFALKNLGKPQKVHAWQLTKVRNKKEVIAEARKEGKTVHFAS